MLKVENLSMSFEKKVLYQNANFRVLPNEKIGVVGINGAGKTTLIQILGHKVIPDSGIIDFRQSIKIGFLDQHLKIDRKLSIKTYLEQAFANLFDIHKQMEDTLQKINQTNDIKIQERLVKTSSNLREQLESGGFYLINSEILKIASGLGINNYGMDTLLGRLSGGQKVKVILAKLLLEQPDFIILDEPTNFLDSIHVDWLVKYLRDYKGTFLVVSHNQEFLNQVVNNILEIENAKITKYKGNYQDYLLKKALKEDEYEKKYASQQKEIAKLSSYIEKNKVRASTATLAKSREKKLAKIEVMARPTSETSHLILKFNYQPISSYKLFECRDLEIGYFYSLLPSITLEVKSGEKIAITGFNGIGKTTFLKTIIGEIKLLNGFFKFVDNVKIAYFAQDEFWENPKQTPFQIIANQWPSMSNKDIRANLAKVDIKGAKVMQPIDTLSGGERSKLKLCLLMLMPSNVLILDEPTNHLDASSKESLKMALKKYEGTIFFVSHEREFLKDVLTREFSIEQLLLK